jgi:iron complex transport system ATP-binding protein
MDLFVAQAKMGRGVALVLHDLALAARYCDRLLLLHHGKVVGEGAPHEILSETQLQRVYGVEAVRGEHNGEVFVLPWKRTQ